MAKNILRNDKNIEISPDFDRKTESKTSSTFDLKHKSLIQFVGTEKKLTSFEVKIIENYIFKAIFQKYKYDTTKFQKFLENLTSTLKQIHQKAENEGAKSLDLETEIEEFLYKALVSIKKELITDAIKKNGLLSFLTIIMQVQLEKENLLNNFLVKKIRYNQKIVFCSNERSGCEYKGKFADCLTHEREECPFEKISCPFLNCKVKELRKEMKTHENVCPFKNNPRNEKKDLSILLHIDESKANFRNNEKKNEDELSSSTDSQDSSIFDWVWLLFSRILNRFRAQQIQISDLSTKRKKPLKRLISFSDNRLIVKFIFIFMLIILCDSLVNSYFFMQMILNISSFASNIQESTLTYLISAAFIFIFDVLITFTAIFHFYFLWTHKNEELAITLKTFFCFNFFRVIVSVIFFSNHNLFEQTQNCEHYKNSNVDSLCQVNEDVELVHYISFAIQTAIMIPLFIIYCKF